MAAARTLVRQGGAGDDRQPARDGGSVRNVLNTSHARVRAALGAMWYRCPPGVREQALTLAGRALAPRAAARRDLRDGGVAVAGLLSAATGLGEGTRLCHDVLARLGLLTGAIDLAPHFGRADVPFEASGKPPCGGGGLLVVHLNPKHLALALALVGRRQLRHRRVVGYWAWELDVLPRSWRAGFDYVHEVWVPSNFVAAAVRRNTWLPVRVVPHPVEEPRASARGRADFGLPEDAFVVLSMLDMASGYVRKNPAGAIQAFKSAFGDRPQQVLVLKIAGAERAPGAAREIRARLAGSSNIKIIHEVLSREDHAALIRCSDVLLSMHRSEGFGLPLAEAMRLGKPVVATGWSGNLEFMTHDNAILINHRLVPVEDTQGIYQIPGARWAEPDLDEAAAWLRRLAANPEMRHRIGGAARSDLARCLSDQAYRLAIRQAAKDDVSADQAAEVVAGSSGWARLASSRDGISPASSGRLK